MPLQVSLVKPLGVRFARGNDGGAYVVRADAKLGSTDSNIEVRRRDGALLDQACRSLHA